MLDETYEAIRRAEQRGILSFCVGVLQENPDICGKRLLRLLAKDLNAQAALSTETIEILCEVGVDVEG
jgi:hypothetical protein